MLRNVPFCVQQPVLTTVIQTGLSMLEDSDKIPPNARDEGATEDDDNPFLDSSNVQIGPPGSLSPSSHLHTLIPILSTLGRPVIVAMDAFNLFALHFIFLLCIPVNLFCIACLTRFRIVVQTLAIEGSQLSGLPTVQTPYSCWKRGSKVAYLAEQYAQHPLIVWLPGHNRQVTSYSHRP